MAVRRAGSETCPGDDRRRDVILVDTSVWIEHLRAGSERLRQLLNNGVVDCHPFVVGELSCGNLSNRGETLGLLEKLPQLVVAEDREVRHLVERRALYGKGLGWVDVHLLASAMIARESLWTLDQPLAKIAHELGVGA